MPVHEPVKADSDTELAKLPMRYKIAICDVFATNGLIDAVQVQLVLDLACMRYRQSILRRPVNRSKASSLRKDFSASSVAKTVSGRSTFINQFVELHAEHMRSVSLVFDPAASLLQATNHWNSFEYVLKTLGSTPRAVSRTRSRPNVRAGFDTNRGMRSRERFYLWEPIFDLWNTGHRGVRFSRTGPIMSILNTLHDGLALDRPSPDTVRDAVKGWRKRKNT